MFSYEWNGRIAVIVCLILMGLDPPPHFASIWALAMVFPILNKIELVRLRREFEASLGRPARSTSAA